MLNEALDKVSYIRTELGNILNDYESDATKEKAKSLESHVKPDSNELFHLHGYTDAPTDYNQPLWRSKLTKEKADTKLPHIIIGFISKQEPLNDDFHVLNKYI